jgi:probable HAF family extracellular repeat protein
MTDLGALAPVDDDCSNTQGINASGEIAGNSENGMIDPLTGIIEIRAVIWKNGQIENLGTLGGNHSAAYWINDRGQVAGAALNNIPDPYSFFDLGILGSSNGTQTRSFLWEKGKKMQDLGTLGGPDAGVGILNERGQIVGGSYTNGTPNSYNGQNCLPNVPTQDPFFWEKGTMIDIGTLGGNCGGPASINNHGQVVGTSDLKGDAIYHPFFWEKGQKIQDLGTFGGRLGAASWINDAGEVVGWAEFKNTVKNHPFLWKKGKKMKDLGILKGDTCDEAWGINSKTQVIGDSGNCYNNVNLRPFLWENGSIYDLSTAFPPNHFQWSEANFINDRGEITGNVILQNGDSHGYLLIPCKAGTKGCKRVTAGAVAHREAIAQNPTTMTEDSRLPSERMGVLGSGFGRRFPQGGSGTDQRK